MERAIFDEIFDRFRLGTNIIYCTYRILWYQTVGGRVYCAVYQLSSSFSAPYCPWWVLLEIEYVILCLYLLSLCAHASLGEGGEAGVGGWYALSLAIWYTPTVHPPLIDHSDRTRIVLLRSHLSCPWYSPFLYFSFITIFPYSRLYIHVHTMIVV